MHPLTRGLTVLAVTASAAAALVRPLAGLVSTEYAVWAGSPLDPRDVGIPPDACPPSGALRVDALDPWGEPYRFRAEGLGVLFHACGPNRADDGGAGAGDDVAVLSRRSFERVADSPWWCGGLALLAGWLAVLSHVWGKPRSERAEVEAWRALVLSLLPAALVGWGVFSHPLWLEPLEPLAGALLVPLPVAVSCGLGFVLFLSALRLRLTRPLPEGVEETPPPWRRILILSLAGVTAAGLLLGWAQRRHARWERIRLLAQAQVGVASAAQAILKFGDDAQVRDFVRTAPAAYAFGDLNDAELQRVAQVGADAWEAMLDVIDDDTPPGSASLTGVRTLAETYLLEQDPDLERLAAAIAAEPGRFRRALSLYSDGLLPRWGRRPLIERLLPGLSDRRLLNTRWNDYRPRACDATLHKLVGLTLDDCPVAPPSVMSAPTPAEYDDAIEAFRAWWATHPALTPACWFELTLRDLPASEAQPLPLATRYELGADGYAESSTEVRAPVTVIRQQLRPRSVEVQLTAQGRTLRIPLDVPARDCTLRVAASWTDGEDPTTTVIEHPR